jgi:branched-subunit amino acid ABC-type transport system permease component
VKRTSYPRAVSRSLKVAALVAIVMLAVIYAVLRQGRAGRATRALHVLPSTARAVLGSACRVWLA